MPTRSINVVVARAHVEGDIQIKAEAPQHLEALVGQAITIKFAVKAVEASRGEETYRFKLSASLDDDVPEPAQEILHDRPGVPDETWLALEQTLRPSRSGRFTLRYEALAEYAVAAWGNADVSQQKVMSQTCAGDIVVTVSDRS